MSARTPSVKRYVVRLSAEERGRLEAMIHKGKSSAARLLKARILLKADVSEAGEGWSDSRIVEALETSVSMVYRARRQLVEEGLEAVLSRKAPARSSVPRIFDGEKEARLIALACSKPPEGHARWSLRLLESKVVELGIVEAASDSTIQRVLKKNALKPHRRKYWVIPPKASGAFVAAMEDVLSVYTRPRDPGRPLVCLDETSKQLVAETRLPIAMRPGQPARIDCEYTRNGVANLFMIFAPLEGWRCVKVTDRRTAVDYAHVLKDLADVHFAKAETIVLVQDNLNTHAAASLYQAFPAAEARRLVERFECHYTPKHGSWLNLAESELGVLASQCLDRRIPDKQTIADQLAAWSAKRNADRATADWRFTTDDARVKLKSLYPSL
ncbi:MAG TPA: IS630 family transposase [Xanthobacteraceae bacterium]